MRKCMFKNFIAIVDDDNKLIADIDLFGKEDTVLMNGYHLVQSDDPMDLIVNEDGDVFLHE